MTFGEMRTYNTNKRKNPKSEKLYIFNLKKHYRSFICTKIQYYNIYYNPEIDTEALKDESD